MHRWFPLGLLVVLAITGCAPSPDAAPAGKTDPPTASTDKTEAVSLTVEDQALVDKQKICPVGGTPLGDHGTPVKVMVGDRAVFICCEGCRQPLLDDPEKHLATLDAAPATEAAPAVEAAPASDPPAAPTTEAAPAPNKES